ncbi:MAG: murein biosynthesis integral membrane protein MurJ [bacterium]|nr:murein biosynthesis integral membrane protein MurJ [bacterium]
MNVQPRQRLAHAATLLAGATVGSRVLGLLREIVVAAMFGASDARAAFVIGYYVPFFVQRLLIGGTLSIVLIPTISDTLARGDESEMRQVTSRLFTLVLAFGVGMVVVGQLAAPALVRLAAPGFAGDPVQLARTVALTRVNFLAMFFLALAVFATAYLQALRRFTAPAVAPLAFNVAIIAGTVMLGPRMGITGLAVAWVAGTAIQFLVQVPALHAAGFRYRPEFDWSHPAIRTVRRLALPAMLGLAIVEINAYVGRFFASLLPVVTGVNAVAALDYAYEMVQAPVGILAISVATVLFPGMSQLASAGDRVGLRQTAVLGLRSLLFLTAPVSLGLAVFARPLVQLVFERGEFGPAATGVVAACLAAYAAGLVPVAAYYVVTRTFYSLKNMRTPVIIGGAMVFLNAVLAYAFMQRMGVAGIALASAVVAFANVGLLLWMLARELGPLGARRIVGTAGRVLVAAASAVWVGWMVAQRGLTDGRFAERADLLFLAVGVGAAVFVYLAACALLRVEELTLVRGLLRRRSARPVP